LRGHRLKKDHFTTEDAEVHRGRKDVDYAAKEEEINHDRFVGEAERHEPNTRTLRRRGGEARAKHTNKERIFSRGGAETRRAEKRRIARPKRKRLTTTALSARSSSHGRARLGASTTQKQREKKLFHA